MTVEARLAHRQQYARPLWDELHAWMKLERTRVPDGGGNVDGVADLRFLHAETVVGVLHRGAHIHAAQAYFKVQPVDFQAGTGGGGKGVLEVSFRVLVVGVPSVGHHAERIAKAQRINAFAGREGEGGVGRGDGRFGGGGEGPGQDNGLLCLDIQGDK